MMGMQPDLSAREVVALHVLAHPGVHQRRLARELGLAGATVHHHVHKLVEEGRLLAHRDGRYVRYFEPTATPQARDLGGLAARDTPARILAALRTMERGSVREIAQRAGLRPSTAGAHLTRLARRMVVVRERVDRRFVYSLADRSREFFAATSEDYETARP